MSNETQVTAEPDVTDPRRVRNFATFFKNYMGVSSFVVAALPIPVAQLELIPVYKSLKGILSVSTSLLCFLTLTFIFFMRHDIARNLFIEHILTGVGNEIYIPEDDIDRRFMKRRRFVRMVIFLILTSASLLFTYLFLLVQSVSVSQESMEVTLATAELRRISLLLPLCMSYVFMFVAAEAAFILMATKEYIQDIIRLSDLHLITAPEYLHTASLRQIREFSNRL